MLNTSLGIASTSKASLQVKKKTLKVTISLPLSKSKLV
jgi:hypothetical protein